jgi:protein SCO1/2
MFIRPSSCLLGFRLRSLAASACVALVMTSSALFGSAIVGTPVYATEVPQELTDIGIKEHLGGKVSIGDLHFKDEEGKDVTLSKYTSRGRPIILAMVYYECPNLCNMLLNGLTDSLKSLDWTPGDQFDIVAVSINPRETPDLAAKKKAAYIKAYGRSQVPGGTASGWHFLTGEESQIKRLASEVGFGYRYDKQEQQYAHAAVIDVLTPEGKVSRYLYGIEFAQRDLRLALTEASSGKIGNVVDRFLLFCFHYDERTKKYSPLVSRIMETGAGGTVLIFGSFLAVFWRREQRHISQTRDDKKGAI